MPGISAELGYTKAQMGTVLIALKLAYGVGQFVNDVCGGGLGGGQVWLARGAVRAFGVAGGERSAILGRKILAAGG